MFRVNHPAMDKAIQEGEHFKSGAGKKSQRLLRLKWKSLKTEDGLPIRDRGRTVQISPHFETLSMILI